MSELSYVAEAPCAQAVPSGTYKVSCSVGDQSRMFHVAADPGYTTCILWDGTSDGYGAVTMVKGTGAILMYDEPDNLHDDHTVIVEPDQPDDKEGSPQLQDATLKMEEDDSSAIFQYVSAFVGVVAAVLAGLLIMKRDD